MLPKRQPTTYKSKGGFILFEKHSIFFKSKAQNSERSFNAEYIRNMVVGFIKAKLKKKKHSIEILKVVFKFYYVFKILSLSYRGRTK